MSLMRAVTTAVAAVVFVCLAATPAWADPATPTNYRSEVTATVPADRFTAEIIGGDAFVRMMVVPGVDVVVLGYEGEPYIWFAPDGTVSVNTRSAATYLNDDRYGRAQLPGTVDVDAEPTWEERASGGAYSWHDHRTHWMSRTPPFAVQDTDGNESVEIFSWTLPLRVDGEPGSIDGSLSWVPSSGSLVWILVAVVSGFLVWLALRWKPRAIAGLLTGTAALALVVAVGAVLAQPSEVRTSGVDIVAPVVALAIGGYAVYRLRHGLDAAARISAVGAAALIVWAVLRFDVFTHPLLPTVLGANTARFSTAVVLGSAGAVLISVLVPALRPRGVSRTTES